MKDDELDGLRQALDAMRAGGGTVPVTQIDAGGPCNCEGCSRDATHMMIAMGTPIVSCEEHLPLMVEAVDGYTSGGGTLTVTYDDDGTTS